MTRIKMGASELVELGRSRCGRGEIVRSGYHRKDGTRVRSTCVPDTGARGKASKAKRTLPTPEPGSLAPWSSKQPDASRHQALQKVVNRRGCRKVIGSLTLLKNISANRHVRFTANADWEWLRDQPFCELKSKKK